MQRRKQKDLPAFCQGLVFEGVHSDVHIVSFCFELDPSN